MSTEPDWIVEQRALEQRAIQASAKAAHALDRLLRLAETSDAGQVSRVVRFIAATYNGEAFKFDLFDLRTVDVVISDDMLACLDALRWGRADLFKLVPNGDQRIQAVIREWGLQ